MTNPQEVFTRAQALLAEHQAACPGFRAIPRRDCAMCDGIQKLVADIMATLPPEPIVIEYGDPNQKLFWPEGAVPVER